MTTWGPWALLLAGAALSVPLIRRAQLRGRSLRRLEEATVGNTESRVTLHPAPPGVGRSFLVSYVWVPVVLGLLFGGLSWWVWSWPIAFAAAVGTICMLMGIQVERIRQDRLIERMELQLADALDLMIAALGAGVGLMQALDAAARELKNPLRTHLQFLVGRIRFGDDPQEALQQFQRIVPLASFRLFASALSVHWESGGSLMGPLAMVARSLRDRIELGRRVRGLSIQAKASTAAILLTTYFIGLVVWRNDPDRFVRFLSTSIGQGIVAGALILQAVGIAWSARLSRLRF